jgi:short-subunit dehydrogenase
MSRPIAEQTVVITGASSGIGRETALEFGRRGAAVVLSARGEDALRQTAEQIREEGGRALAIVADVTDFAQVRRLADQAVAWSGRIDTWVNNAGVAIYGTVEETDVEEIEQLFRINVMGQFHGVKAVLPIMNRQGGGTIINVGSIESMRAFPLHAHYSASKHAVKAFTEALRLEQEHAGTGIVVTLIKPGAINTPLFEHARAKTGRKPLPPPPIYDPAVVADAICFAAEHPRREITVGMGKLFPVLERISPALTDRLLMVGDMAFESQQGDEPDNAADNLFAPLHDGRARSRGEFVEQSKSSSLYTKIFEYHPAVAWGVLGGVAGLGLAALLTSKGRGEPRDLILAARSGR